MPEPRGRPPTPEDEWSDKESRILRAARVILARDRSPTAGRLAAALGWSRGCVAATLARLEARGVRLPEATPKAGRVARQGLGLPGGARPDVEAECEAIRQGWGEEGRRLRRDLTMRRLGELARGMGEVERKGGEG